MYQCINVSSTCYSCSCTYIHSSYARLLSLPCNPPSLCALISDAFGIKMPRGTPIQFRNKSSTFIINNERWFLWIAFNRIRKDSRLASMIKWHLTVRLARNSEYGSRSWIDPLVVAYLRGRWLVLVSTALKSCCSCSSRPNCFSALALASMVERGTSLMSSCRSSSVATVSFFSLCSLV